jgi:DUF218 domain
LKFELSKWHLPLRLFRRRTIICPTWTGLSGIALLVFAPIAAWFLYGESYLSETHRSQADVLVVEGWIGREGLRAALEEFTHGGYQYIVVSGGLTSGRWEDQSQSYAEMAARELIRLSLPKERLLVATSEKTERYRTFESAVAVWRTLHATALKPKGLNIFTFGPHARRSALVFSKVNSDIKNVGVIGWWPLEFQKECWWQSSERSKEFWEESIGYLYEVLLNSGRSTNFPEVASSSSAPSGPGKEKSWFG